MEERRRYSILLVEDELLIREYIKFTLLAWGYRIAGEAATGEAAIRMVEENSTDLVLMDIRLKGDMDGIEAARSIRATSDVPILFMSAYEEKDVAGQGSDGLSSGYIKKPIDEEHLRRTIGNVLDGR